MTLTPLGQLLPDKAAPSVLLCSGEIWHCSPRFRYMSVASISFLLQIIPCDTSITCNYEALSQAFYSEELGGHVDLIPVCVPFFSKQSTF